jgi:hypothetical protein
VDSDGSEERKKAERGEEQPNKIQPNGADK